MAYDEQEARRSRVVVETPTERREVVHSQSVRSPEGGMSAGMVGVLVVVAIALITMLVLFWMSSQPTSDPNANLVAQQPTPIVQQVPAQQPPVIIQQPAPAPVTQPAPIIISPPAGGSTETSPANNDAAIQLNVDKHLTDDPAFSSLGITATVLDGKVTLLGTVKTEAIKSDIEKMVKRLKGVKAIDNQITVVAD